MAVNSNAEYVGQCEINVGHYINAALSIMTMRTTASLCEKTPTEKLP